MICITPGFKERQQGAGGISLAYSVNEITARRLRHGVELLKDEAKINRCYIVDQLLDNSFHSRFP